MPLERVFDEILVDYFSSVAAKAGVDNADLVEVFSFPSVSPVVLPNENTVIDLMFSHEFDASVSMEAMNSAMIIGRGRQHKTTGLVCLGTLLGYDWDSRRNQEFLNDSDFVDKGKAVRDWISGGVPGKLRVQKGNRSLSIDVKDATAQIVWAINGESQSSTCDVRSEWSRFVQLTEQLIDVEMVGKGRKFIQRVDLEVFEDVALLSRLLLTRATELLRGYAGRQTSQSAFAPELDEDAISADLAEAEEELELYTQERLQINTRRGQVELIRKWLGQIEASGDRAHLERLIRAESELQVLKDEAERYTSQRALVEQLTDEVHRRKASVDKRSAELQTIDTAFQQLHGDVSILLTSTDTASWHQREILGNAVQRQDISAVVGLMNIDLTVESVAAYEALLNVLRGSSVRPSTHLIPLDSDILTAGDLAERLRVDLIATRSQLELNEAIKGFSDGLQVMGISLTLDEFQVGELAQSLSASIRELERLEAELEARREAASSSSAGPDVGRKADEVDEIRSRVSADLLELRENVDTAVRQLAEVTAATGKRVWSADATSFLALHDETLNQQAIDNRIAINSARQKVETLKAQLQAARQREEPWRSSRDRLFEFHALLTVVRDVADVRSKARPDDQSTRDAEVRLAAASLSAPLDNCVNRVILRRCQNYYLNDGGTARAVPLSGLDYDRHTGTVSFKVGGETRDGTDLSGGTASVMTVRALTSRPSAKPFGLAVFVDEWGDVEDLGPPLYAEITNFTNLVAALFVKVVTDGDRRIQPLN